MTTERELRLLSIVTRMQSGWTMNSIPREVRTGNPYHDEDGKFTHGPGGGGKNAARRRRRRARLLKRREALRKSLKAQAKLIRGNHRAERRQYRRDDLRARKSLVREQRRERSKLIRDARRDIAKAKTAGERNEVRQYARHGLEVMKEEHASARKSLREEQAEGRAGLKRDHEEEWDSFRKDIKLDADDLRAEFGIKAKRGLDSGVTRAIGKARIHKAGSAESILRHCLRARGWTKQFRAGELTGDQYRELLDDIRLYARNWLRHEAEQFVRHYLQDARGIRSIGEVRPLPEGFIDRARWVWTPGPGGVLHGDDHGFVANLGRFFGRVKTFVREAIVAGAMSIFGPDPLTGKELDAAEAAAVKQDEYFDRFHHEILAEGKPAPTPPKPEPGQPVPLVPVQEPPMTPGQFVARVERYGNSTWHLAQQANRRAAIEQGVFKLERRVLGHPKTEHCHDCPPLAAQGWQPIGTLPDIGMSECGPLCLCHFEYKAGPDDRPYFQGSRGPVPAPSAAAGVEMLPDDGGVYMVAEPPGQKLDVPIAGPPKK